MKAITGLAVSAIASIAMDSKTVLADTESMDITPDSSEETAQVNDSQTVEITSPTRYEADDTKEVGYQDIKTQGQAGTMILTPESITNKVIRVEPTETVVTLGTKPIEEGEVDKATVEYIADDTADFGTSRIEVQAQDGKTTTKTTYKIITQADYDFGKDTEFVTSEQYQYRPEKFWTIDDSQVKPSDKVVIKDLFSEIKEIKTEEISRRERVEAGNGDFSFNNKIWLTSEMLDPNNPNVVAKLAEQLERPVTEDDVYKYLFTTSLEDLYNLDIIQRGARSQEEAVKNYFMSHSLPEALYADAKADYLRLKMAATYLMPKYPTGWSGNYPYMPLGDSGSLATVVQQADKIFETITQRYNNLHSDARELNIEYKNTSIPEDSKKFLEETIQKLPYEIRKNLLKLTVTDDDLPAAAKTATPDALASPASKHILLNYDAIRVNEKLREVFLHELAHVIDFNSGLATVSTIAYASSIRQLGFSATPEFKEVYDKYIKDKVLPPYYRDNIEEAFAEFFGQYINHRVFGASYPRFVEYNGKIRAIRDYQPYYKDDEDKVDMVELYSQYYATAYSPIEEAEPYFAKLYADLFERPSKAEVVVDTVATVSVDRQDGKIALGTKPQVEVVKLAYDTEYQANPNLSYGEKILVQAGQPGTQETRTTYTLVDRQTGEITRHIDIVDTDTPLTEIYELGTKPTVEIKNIAYITEEISDDTLLVGVRKLIQAGKEGKYKHTTLYALVDKQTGQLQEQVIEELVEEAVPEIYAVGTKVTEKEAEPALKEEFPENDKLKTQNPSIILSPTNHQPEMITLAVKVPQTSPSVMAEPFTYGAGQTTVTYGTTTTQMSRVEKYKELPKTGTAITMALEMIGVSILASLGWLDYQKQRKSHRTIK